MPRKSEPRAVKASESVVIRQLARLLGVSGGSYETVADVITAHADENSDPLVDFLSYVVTLYPWNCTAANDVMRPDVSALAEHLMSRPGQAFVVKDTAASGDDSIWVAIADPDSVVDNSLERMPCRGVMHTFRVSSSHSKVIAIQLSSCLQ